MDTIAINAADARNDEKQDKEKLRMGDKAKATMATGIAGVAAGMGVKAVVDALRKEDPDGNELTGHEGQGVTQETAGAEAETTEETVAEVNPDDVMLEEPIEESEMSEEEQIQSGEGDDYRPFANNDEIVEEMLPEPQPEREITAQNDDVVVLTGEDVLEEAMTVDVICGTSDIPEYGIDPTDLMDVNGEAVCGGDLFAENGPALDDADIQSNLMV